MMFLKIPIPLPQEMAALTLVRLSRIFNVQELKGSNQSASTLIAETE